MNSKEVRVLNDVLLQMVTYSNIKELAQTLKIKPSVMSVAIETGVVSRINAAKLSGHFNSPFEGSYSWKTIELEAKTKPTTMDAETPKEILDLPSRVNALALHFNGSVPRLFQSKEGLASVIQVETYRKMIRLGRATESSLNLLLARIEILELRFGLAQNKEKE